MHVPAEFLSCARRTQQAFRYRRLLVQIKLHPDGDTVQCSRTETAVNVQANSTCPIVVSHSLKGRLISLQSDKKHVMFCIFSSHHPPPENVVYVVTKRWWSHSYHLLQVAPLSVDLSSWNVVTAEPPSTCIFTEYSFITSQTSPNMITKRKHRQWGRFKDKCIIDTNTRSSFLSRSSNAQKTSLVHCMLGTTSAVKIGPTHFTSSLVMSIINTL